MVPHHHHSSTAVTIIILAITLLHTPSRVQSIGVNWGTAASHPLPPSTVVDLLKLNKITKVKLFDTDPQILEALSGSSIDVTVGIPNSMLRSLNASVKVAENWVHDNLTRYISGRTRIEYVNLNNNDSDVILIGIDINGIRGFLSLIILPRGVNELIRARARLVLTYEGFVFKLGYITIGDEPFLQRYGSQFYPYVVGAAVNVEAALIRAKLSTKVKIVIPCSFDAFGSESGQPSKGHFRHDINKTMIEVLNFLTKTRSPLFVNISPFLSYYQNKKISLDFALFKETARPHNDTRRIYKNSFELSYDTLVTALTVLGFPNIDIVVSEICWPTDGAPNATVSNAEIFTKGILDFFHSGKGTPLRPKVMPLEIYLYALLDEDQKNITAGNFERHWGLFTFDGQAKYQVDFGQSTKRVGNAQGVEYFASRWCVVNNNINMSNATARAMEACTNADCTALSPGSSCFNLSWPGNVSYAFNSYYQQHDQRADSCDFGGLGMITTVDPSVGNCRFNVELKASSSVLLRGSKFDYFFILIALLGWLLLDRF